ncbi:uncharacterized protein LOC127716576 isoform X1 [Mytilus californianus]|uniref:uncharacterized protein LOC127716576 isoform X1 n=1 Tax=Mytilus californianus TaxID=6549 RepID=UPI0022479148|nr:uncharacterized protein LOC127716576 isoform X1 [Mytilus californianus]
MDRDDKRRYFIVGSVIMEVVTPLFRTRLERDYTSKGLTSLQAFLNTQPVIHILFHLHHKISKCCVGGQNCNRYKQPSLPLINFQWKQLYSEKPGNANHSCHCKFTANPVQLEDLDITLSSLILLNCNNLTPADNDAVKCLRQYKNDNLSHNTTSRISQTKYNSLWTDLTNFVLQLDPSKQDDLMRIERRPLDEVLCNSYTLNLLDFHEKLDEIDTSIQGVRSDIQGNNANMQEILLYIRKDRCSCLCEKSEQQNKEPRYIKPYTLGQDVFQLHHQINLTSETHESIHGFVSDIEMMDDGRLVICLPDQKRLLICNTDGSQVDSIDLQGGPLYLTAVNNSTVAVTLYDSGRIEMYDINNKLKLKSISVPGMWWWGSGITTINNKLVVHGDNSLLIIDHQTGVVIQKLQTSCFLDRLHGSGDRIFYWVNYQYINKLYWYSYTDARHHTLTLPSPPRRMTTLQDGSLYVKCEDGSLQHVSSDGEEYKTVTTKGLQKIDCLTYNLKQRQMVTKSMDKTIFDVFCD